MSNIVVSEPKFTGLSSANAGGIAVDDMSFRLWISLPVPERYSNRDRSLKLSEIAPNFARFWPRNFV